MPDTMNHQSTGADTRMMGVVHRALLRDLDRADRALDERAEGREALPDHQRVALAEHVGWMMGFLGAHHASEDEGLYPAVRERRPDVAPLLERMDQDHRALEPAIVAVESAAAALRTDGTPAARAALLDALRQLHGPLADHLRREEDDVLPIVSACLSDAEWRAIEKRHNLDGKSLRELGLEGHWLIDGVTAEDRAVVLGVVPAIPRQVLVLGFARAYRRRRDACWSGTPPRRTVQQHGRVAVTVDAPIDAVRAVLHDITRQGEWSHECVETRWLDGSTAPAVGARFRGRNAQGMFRWGRLCEIVTADPDQLAWRTVPTAFTPDSTRWSIALSAGPGGGTRIEQSFDVLRGSKLLAFCYSLLVPAHRDRLEALRDDLRRLGAVAARDASAPA